MLASISRNWWLVALRGALAVVFGIAAFVWPGITFGVLVLLFGAYAFIDGVVVLGFGLMAAGDHEQWWPLVLGGIVGIAVGVGWRLHGLAETVQTRTQSAASVSR